MIYRARRNQLAYGRPIGILMLEESIPCPPGTMGNPTTFHYPVRFEIVKGVDISSLRDLNNPDSFRPFLDAAHLLIDKGAAAITGNCGLMIVHQERLAKALPIPVLMSSLVQLPTIAQLLTPQAQIGIIAASRRSLKREHLLMATGGADIPIALATMDDCPHFRAAIGDQNGILDSEKVEIEAVAVARNLVEQNPDIRAILLECTDLPPYAAAIQDAVDLPIFDITTLVDYIASGLVRRPFRGTY